MVQVVAERVWCRLRVVLCCDGACGTLLGFHLWCLLPCPCAPHGDALLSWWYPCLAVWRTGQLHVGTKGRHTVVLTGVWVPWACMRH